MASPIRFTLLFIFIGALSSPVTQSQEPATPDGPVNFPEVTDVDHATLIRAWDDEAFERGKKFYQTVCFACHGIDWKLVTGVQQ